MKIQIILSTIALAILSACADMPLETDISQANINSVCPVDVTEADRANYPACN